MRFLHLSLILPVLAANAASYDRYGGYLPSHKITDEAAIDLDQEVFNEELANRKETEAWKVYTEGGHSGSYAALTLTVVDQKGTFPAGTKVYGYSQKETEIVGYLRKPVTIDGSVKEVEIEVLYEVRDTQANYLDCQVGGLPYISDVSAVNTGCFADVEVVFLTTDEGQAKEDGVQFSYTYDWRRDNRSFRTLQKFSTEAKTKMKGIDGKYYPEFQTFLDYYGESNPDYADKWITAARYKQKTDFKLGNSDFSLLHDRPGQGEAMKKGAAYLNVWMEVVREVNEAVAYCNADFEEAEKSVDEAVAYYTGSLATLSGETGILLYALAEVRAHQFRTAGHLGDKDSGDAFVNVEIMKEFKALQGLVYGQDPDVCRKALERKTRIVQLMKIPMIQGALRYAYIRDKEEPRDIDEADRVMAESATFAAAILPFVHQCGSREAEVIHKNLEIGAKTNYNDVKVAFARVYDCLEVTCDLVGGPWDHNEKDYKSGADPCKIETSKNGGAIFGKFVGISAGVILAGWLFLRYRHKITGVYKRKDSYPEMSTGNIAAVAEIA